MTMEMFITEMKRTISDIEYHAYRFRLLRYHAAKGKIPMNLPPAEYEARVKRLLKKYKI